MTVTSFLSRVGGRVTEVLTILTSAGAGDSGKVPALDATGKLDLSFLPSGLGGGLQIVCSENLAAGALVNIFNSSGTIKVRNADNTSAAKPADGYVLAAFTTGQTATVYFEGAITGLTGLTLGAYEYLGTVGGTVEAAPTGANVVSQIVGRAISTSSIQFLPQEPITLAQ